MATNYWCVCIDHPLEMNCSSLSQSCKLQQYWCLSISLCFYIHFKAYFLFRLRLQFGPAVLLNIQEQPCTWEPSFGGLVLADIWYINLIRFTPVMPFRNESSKSRNKLIISPPAIDSTCSFTWASISCTNHWTSMYYTDSDFTN